MRRPPLALTWDPREHRQPRSGRDSVAVAVVQEFPIEGNDRSTTNYEAVQTALNLDENPVGGGLVHTAGFDEEEGVFRIFDVWESEEAWNAFWNDACCPSSAR